MCPHSEMLGQERIKRTVELGGVLPVNGMTAGAEFAEPRAWDGVDDLMDNLCRQNRVLGPDDE